ncbi:3'-5' exonuclease [Crenobacter cavernae]|uniref:3'-5' exonuclease n=1 Tax=Crenobacter cavernae TaxID=2290923 RepID=A0ABY0FH12_9NEIS|nr:3'-5' exonuclease [Crenobacter cavernae]RXZ45683.1 3'-5' exonuclease [Crenobacter cavernae]
MLAAIRRRWLREKLSDPRYAFLFDEVAGELVSLDCETTSLDADRAELLSIAAVKIVGHRVLTSSAFSVLVRPERRPEADSVKIHGLRPRDVEHGVAPAKALAALLDFVGGRPLVGYYLEYDLAVLGRYLRPLIGIGLPNRAIEISARYYDYKARQHPGAHVDLSWAPLLADLKVPALARHDALNDAITAALAYQALAARGFG